MNQEKIGMFIAECRKEKNLTQKDLAEKLGVTDKAISKWENGRCMPDISSLQTLTSELGITINELLSGEKIVEEEKEEKSEENIFALLKKVNKTYTRLQKILLCLMLVSAVTGSVLFNFGIGYSAVFITLTLILGLILCKTID